eukprot:CAMPEP_0182437728 /NCGR_PEP_ID=MMETSP1167-20130531/85244_1 /TAXON_ID=2988 /ORGANISM="Mallomonas Sp, Strain CCMP3275" /LENGTH=418 /DNA_ID=CAMNT_0024630751 /DNA_START=102 /DNA_END=1359 /DNA_ORIENTATION=+
MAGKTNFKLLILLASFCFSNSTDAGSGTCAVGDEVCKEKALLASILPKGANTEGKPRAAVKACTDRHEQCKAFARNGECQRNPGWMIINCGASCNNCHLRDPKIRCNRKALNISTEPVYMPGDMSAMFNDIERLYGDRYNVTVHSRAPWVVTFDDFMTPEETTAIIGTVDKWERSTDTGSANEFGEVGRVLSQGRTSSNAWCREACERNPHVQNVMKKIAEVTRVPTGHYESFQILRYEPGQYYRSHSDYGESQKALASGPRILTFFLFYLMWKKVEKPHLKIAEVTRVPTGHYESFQILRYEPGQYYRSHHDYGPTQKALASGPRILTFFLYLSDVEEGGETSFTNLKMKIKPKRGRALLWPSTLDEEPEEQDWRTHHGAEPVIKGLKFAANAWIHLYDFRIPNLWGCTGTFDELSD